MELGAITIWVEEVDAIYDEVGHEPVANQLLLFGVLRAWLWPLYEMAD